MPDLTTFAPFNGYRSTHEAANFLGVHRKAVNLAVARGYLRGIKHGRDLWIHIDDLRAYAARQQARARSGAAKRAKKTAKEAGKIAV